MKDPTRPAQASRIVESRRESGMVQRMRASLRRGGTGCPHVLVGFSGGQDSLALTVLIASLARAGALTAEIAHIDHAFRATSEEAASGVRAIGDVLGLGTHVVRLDPDTANRHPGVGPEEALRRERYRAFSRIARNVNADAIALAHHQRDQAETVLLHLLRGAGLSGAIGMREWSEAEVPWWPGAGPDRTTLRIWRPLLGESFENVAEFAAATGFPVFEDETNEERRFRRNAIRHDVLPLLETIVTGATANLARFAGLAAEEDAALEALAMEALQSPGLLVDGGLQRAKLLDYPYALQRRIVLAWLPWAGFDGELSADRIEAVVGAAVRNRSGTRIQLEGGQSVEVRRGVLWLTH